MVKSYQPFLYTWVRAKLIEFNNCPTRCGFFSLLHFCRQLYMFRALTPIIRSSYKCNYSFWYWLTWSSTIRSRCWVGTDSCLSYGRYSFVITNVGQLLNSYQPVAFAQFPFIICLFVPFCSPKISWGYLGPLAKILRQYYRHVLNTDIITGTDH